MAFAIEEFANAKLTNVSVPSEKHGPDQLNPPTDPFHPVNQQSPEDAFAAAVASEQA